MPAQLRPSESFDSGYGSVGDEAEREAVGADDNELEAVEAEDKENVPAKRSYSCYDESDSEVGAAEIKNLILSFSQSSPKPENVIH